MTTIQELINNVSDKQLREFVIEYAKRDGDFSNALSVRFAVPEFEAEVTKIADMVENELEGVDDYRRRDSWGYIRIDLSKVDYEIQQRIAQGQYRLAFAQSAAAYAELLEVYEYQSECEISDEAGSFVDKMSDIAGEVTDSADQAYIYERCVELAYDDTASDYGDSYQGRFLKIAARFITQTNREEFDAAIEKFSGDYRGEELSVIKLTTVRRLDGDSAAEQYISQNLQYDSIRKIAYDNAMSARDFAKAEQLCIDALESDTRSAHKWRVLLYLAYEAAGERLKMAETAEALILSGDLEYYDKLKSIYAKLGGWNEFYPAMLTKCKASLRPENYMHILSKENELALLLEQVQIKPDLIYDYGKQLAPAYPDEVETLFVKQIAGEADRAGDRKAYAQVCGKIKMFRTAGYDERAGRLIDDYKLRFKKRPAFLDELRKIG
ncbi:MAG: hypothetical protein LBI74_08420 [Synergistaceae bacterium]|nr:hypothetical protein [Synergistaceae bacterium]